ncbi:putative annexin [Helianthus annuus]|nr:putative annexin [Helianthus annuus]
MAILIVLPSAVSPREDAIQLYKAFKGFGSDDAAVIGILAHRDATQRAYIQQEYKTMYSEDILKRLSAEHSGKLEVFLLWMLDPAQRDAKILIDALSPDCIDLEAVTEVRCSRTSLQLQTLKQIYHSTCGTYLEHDIELQASRDHQKILLACVNKPRYEGPEVDREMAAKDAKALYKAGEKKLGTDFVKIFSERSNAQLIAINTCYHDMYGGSLKKVIKKETSGLFEHALLTILQCAENTAKYFAKVKSLVNHRSV